MVDPAEFASAPCGFKVRCAAVTPQVHGNGRREGWSEAERRTAGAGGRPEQSESIAPPLHALKERLPELLEDAAKKETAARLAVPLNVHEQDAPGCGDARKRSPRAGLFTGAVAGDRDFTKRTTSCPLGPREVGRIGTPQDFAGFADLPGLSLEAASRKWKKARALDPIPGSGWTQKIHFQGGSGRIGR